MKNRGRNKGILTKLLVFQLLIALEHQTRFQSNAKTQYSYLMEENYLYIHEL